MASLLDYVVSTTSEYIDKMPKTQRKKYGQFFTSKATAVYMAGLFSIPENKESLFVLDAGAGSGILSAALMDRLQEMESIKKVVLVCYENDSNITELLRENLEWVREHSDLDISFEIRIENYILSYYLEYNQLLGAKHDLQKFDMVIGNPPYMKIAGKAPEATAMPDVCYGAPNLYFLFTAMSVFNTAPNGELVYIIPRSWTSGAYFKKFRQKIFSECILEHIHLFDSRDKVFDKESVLQETIIIKLKKTSVRPQNICITSTISNNDFCDITTFEAPYNTVVTGKDCYVFLVTSEGDIEILEQINKWDNTLPQLGMPMKTGLIVDFRNRDVLRNSEVENSVPVFYSHHIKDGSVVFPSGRENEYAVTNQMGLLQNNENYLFIKRFTAKEERRRLQCGIYMSRKYPQYGRISTQNKINFIGGSQNLSECVVYGLYVLFNSTYYDRYYRMLNGSTQVNSSEMNSMPIPPLSCIEKMGAELMELHDLSVGACDCILRRFIYEENGRGADDITGIASAS